MSYSAMGDVLNMVLCIVAWAMEQCLLHQYCPAVEQAV
ncbi:hypothetical protein Cenrod_1945 [Candidatus Symbiobacter mobilis CR]|uniref:Uncharacterized protein n=1 Tax=Candidatus Symbiobacter mobilis CR TaxID=946483 RepID=U5N8Z7_9BURK|nr:hypothetical protein Cenrod_1945 [Candidatus Symbiobacter mobilis CR]